MSFRNYDSSGDVSLKLSDSNGGPVADGLIPGRNIIYFSGICEKASMPIEPPPRSINCDVQLTFADLTTLSGTCDKEPSLDNAMQLPAGNCDLSYPDVCIASPPPDLNCDDITDRGFKVLSPDPHGLDSDSDGVGCETESSEDISNMSSSPNEAVQGVQNSASNESMALVQDTQIGECKGSADCFRGIVTEIVDGDTLDVNNVRIRLSMVNTPERGEPSYKEATELTESVCPVGETALVDEDDGQKEGSYDRLIGAVYCNGNNMSSLNQILLEEGKARVYEDFCDVSEFANEDWVTKYGC
jgi:endonuclease YncB( thermonuclease family)